MFSSTGLLLLEYPMLTLHTIAHIEKLENKYTHKYKIIMNMKTCYMNCTIYCYLLTQISQSKPLTAVQQYLAFGPHCYPKMN